MIDTPPSASTITGAPPADLAFGAFSDCGPWVVDPDATAWRGDAVRLRDAAHA